MRENFIEIAWLIILCIYIPAIQMIVPPPWNAYAGWSGIAILVFGLWFEELMVFKIVGSYTHLYAIIRGVETDYRRHLYVKEYREFPLQNGLYRTELILGKPAKFPEFGKVKRVFVIHRLRFEERIRLKRGRAFYQGVWIDHPKSDTVVLWMMYKPVVDHGEVLPQFILKEAGADRIRMLSSIVSYRGAVYAEA